VLVHLTNLGQITGRRHIDLQRHRIFRNAHQHYWPSFGSLSMLSLTAVTAFR
jgi:hypothetical protein